MDKAEKLSHEDTSFLPQAESVSNRETEKLGIGKIGCAPSYFDPSYLKRSYPSFL